MDLLVLYITSVILHIKIKPKRLVLSAVSGALYSLLTLYVKLSKASSVLLAILISFILIFVAFGKMKIKRFVTSTVLFYGINFALGGGISALANLFGLWQNSRKVSINGTFDTIYGNIPLWLILTLGIFCGIISLFTFKNAKKRVSSYQTEFTVSFNKKTLVLRGFADSGNFLCEPISGKPVIIVSYNSLRTLFPTEILPLLKEYSTDLILKAPYFRIIPTQSIGGKGFLFGFSPDSITVSETSVDAFIAVDITKKEYNNCDAVIPAEIIP